VSDIKTDNILLQYNEQGLIIPFFIDFGLSGFFKGKVLNVKSQNGGKVKLKMEAEHFMDKFPHYPPECARGEPTSKAGDVFGLGRLYMRMFRAMKAIKRHNLSKQFFQVFHACMRDHPQERLRLSVLRTKLSEIAETAAGDPGVTLTKTPPKTVKELKKNSRVEENQQNRVEEPQHNWVEEIQHNLVEENQNKKPKQKQKHKRNPE